MLQRETFGILFLYEDADIGRFSYLLQSTLKLQFILLPYPVVLFIKSITYSLAIHFLTTP